MIEITREQWLVYKKNNPDAVFSKAYKINGSWRGYRYFLKKGF